MFSKGRKQPAYERLCCIADDLGMRVGISTGEMVPCSWNLNGEANGWRSPLTKLTAFQGLAAKADTLIDQPDSDLNFIRACARLSGILGLYRAA